MREKIGWCFQTGLFPLRDRDAELFCIPVYYDGGEQVQPGDTEVLTFSGAVADFSLSADPQGILQGVMRLAFIETDLSTALHIGIERPFDDEQCPLNAPDLPKGDSQIMLPWACRQFLQKLTGLHSA